MAPSTTSASSAAAVRHRRHHGCVRRGTAALPPGRPAGAPGATSFPAGAGVSGPSRVVALTGGASRIADAIELLASGRGKRLLISGANRATNSNEISRLNPEFERWVRCCVDFDRSLNTLGNAIETRRWAESRGFRSLIIVTSNYHMPRALAEIAHQLPDVALVPFPVVTDRQRAEPWWASSATTRLMLSEYVKYIFARLRMGLNPTANANVPGRKIGRLHRRTLAAA